MQFTILVNQAGVADAGTNDSSSPSHSCKVCLGPCSDEHFREQDDWVCQVCADRIANLYNFARSGDYLSWPNQPREISRTERWRRKNTPSAQQRLRIFRRDNFNCHYCGSSDQLQIDHKVPISKGGDCSDKNLLTACKECNIAKSDMDYEDFVKSTAPPSGGVQDTIWLNYWGVERAGLTGPTDAKDWAILDYISRRISESCSEWLWLHYEQMIYRLPLLKIKSKSSISKRLKNLESLSLVEIDRSKGSAVFLRLTSKCYEIMTTPPPEDLATQGGE